MNGDDVLEDLPITLRFPRGIDLIAKNACPLKSTAMAACIVCSQGHFLECHYPQNCAEARCSHYEREMDSLG